MVTAVSVPDSVVARDLQVDTIPCSDGGHTVMIFPDQVMCPDVQPDSSASQAVHPPRRAVLPAHV